MYKGGVVKMLGLYPGQCDHAEEDRHITLSLWETLYAKTQTPLTFDLTHEPTCHSIRMKGRGAEGRERREAARENKSKATKFLSWSTSKKEEKTKY